MQQLFFNLPIFWPWQYIDYSWLFHIARLVDQRAQKLICASSKWFQSYFWTPVSDLASRKVIQDWLWTAILLPVLYIRPFSYHIAWQHCFASPHLLVSLHQLLLFIPSKWTKKIRRAPTNEPSPLPSPNGKWQTGNPWCGNGAQVVQKHHGWTLVFPYTNALRTFHDAKKNCASLRVSRNCQGWCFTHTNSRFDQRRSVGYTFIWYSTYRQS